MAARTRAWRRLEAPGSPSRAGAPIKPITSTTPTATMALTTVKAVTRVSSRRRRRTGRPALAAPRGSTPKYT